MMTIAPTINSDTGAQAGNPDVTDLTVQVLAPPATPTITSISPDTGIVGITECDSADCDWRGSGEYQRRRL